jgi:hypothetical protein
MRNRISIIFLVLAVLLICPIVSHAQATGTASITGVVTDSTGAVVPGASIKVTDTRTGTDYFAKTAGDGSYHIVDLPPGPGYSVTVTKDSFQTLSIANVYLPVAVTTTQDVTLQLGSVGQTINVTAEGSVTLNTTDTTIGNNIDSHAIQSLPNEFRDNPANLLRLEVGVVSAQTPPGQPASGTGAIDPNLTRDGAVAGARTDQNNILVDGIDATNISSGFAFQAVGAVPVEAIQEFTTLVANPTPEYGGGSGAQTLITTKSGTNAFHGSAYEYNRTAATEANNYFNNQSDIPRTALIRNQFGSNIGGPIWKDKAFFFFEFDGRRDRESAPVLEIVPMPHVALGELAYINNSGGGSCPNNSRLTSADVSTACVTILTAAQVQALDPCSHVSCAGTPGFVTPGTAPSLQSLFSSRYPTPNDYSVGDGLNSAGFRFNTPTPLTENEYLSREDFNLNSKNQLFARFNFRDETSVLVPNAFPGDPLTSPDVLRDRSWVLGETWLATSNLVNRFTYGETRQNEQQPILFNPSGGLYELEFDSGLVSNPYLRQSAFGTIAPEPTFRDDVTWVHGNHTFSFGGEWNPVTIHDILTNDFAFIQEGLGGNIPSLPTYSASNPINVSPMDLLNDPVAIDAWDGALVGALGSIWNLQASINYTGTGEALPPGSNVSHTYRIQNLAGYVNDSWKVRPSLTLSLGVRYQFQTPPYEIHGVQASYQNTNFKSIIAARESNGEAGIFGPDSTPLLTYSLSGKANHASAIYTPEYHDLSPRIGLAWNPSSNSGFLGKLLGDRKTVIRAGASIIDDETVVNNIIQLENQSDYTFGGSFAEGFGVSSNPIASLETEPRFNAIDSSPVPVIAPAFQTPITPFALFNYDVDNQYRTPYSIVTSFGIQRELPWGLQVEADYYGRFGRRLFVLADAGQAINIVDPFNKAHSLVGDFTTLEKEAQANSGAGVDVSTVTPLPFFEDTVPIATGLSCPALNGVIGTPFSDCTQAVYSIFQSALAQGSTAGVLYGLGYQPTNIGLTPQFAVNALGTNLGNSSYNGLFVTLRKKFTHDLQFDFDYTYSHSIDNNSTVPHANGNFEPGVTTILCDATNGHVCRGNSEFDATHQFTGFFVYNLPFGHGEKWGSGVNTLVNEAIGGWQISGIPTWRSGLALTVDNGIASTTSLASDAGDLFVGPQSALKQHIHRDPALDNGVQLYANPTAAAGAFVPLTGLEVGTRDNLRGPHFANLDFSVLKNFPLGSERFKLQFVAQAFNVFNHTNFGLPDPDLNGGTFGELTSEAGDEDSRVMQFGLRFDF